jgi:hypothetical protein
MRLMTIGHPALPGRSLLAVAAGACLMGCAASVTVDANFPTPLVEPLPVRVGLIFDEELQQFEHYEEIPRQSRWSIQLGKANVAMLTPLFEQMFMETRPVSDLAVAQTDASQLDGFLRPSLEAFEFDVPTGTRRDQFVEVWIQYQLALYEPNGELVVEWPVSGYGKAEYGRNRERALNRAATVAMREVGAAISTQFARQPQVSYWLQERAHEGALPASGRLNN